MLLRSSQKTKSNVYRKASSIITNVLVDFHINFRFSGVNRTRKCSCSILLSLPLMTSEFNHPQVIEYIYIYILKQ